MLKRFLSFFAKPSNLYNVTLILDNSDLVKVTCEQITDIRKGSAVYFCHTSTDSFTKTCPKDAVRTHIDQRLSELSAACSWSLKAIIEGKKIEIATGTNILASDQQEQLLQAAVKVVRREEIVAPYPLIKPSDDEARAYVKI